VRVEAYIRVLAEENTIRSIHAETNLPNGSIEQLKAPRNVSSAEMWWNWQTKVIPIDADNLDDGLRALLNAHKPIFPIIRRYRGPEVDIYLEVVTHYDEGEEPQGLYLSAETIQLLGEMGGALDNDVVVTVAGRSQER